MLSNESMSIQRTRYEVSTLSSARKVGDTAIGKTFIKNIYLVHENLWLVKCWVNFHLLPSFFDFNSQFL